MLRWSGYGTTVEEKIGFSCSDTLTNVPFEVNILPIFRDIDRRIGLSQLTYKITWSAVIL